MAYWLRQVRQGCLQACHYFKGLSKGAQGLLEQELALLHIQANLVSIAETIPGTSGTRDALAQVKGIPMPLISISMSLQQYSSTVPMCRLPWQVYARHAAAPARDRSNDVLHM